MYSKVLVANRGAVAARVIRALKGLGIRSAVLYSDADKDLPYVAQADEAIALPGSAATETYLNQPAVLAALATCGADAVHPGYGFLSENAGFARRVTEAGAGFIGPSPQWIEAMGHKTRARDTMASLGMPMSRSSGLLGADAAANLREAAAIGFPVLVKPAGGGGGIGMVAARSAEELERAVGQARALTQRSFACDDLYLERLMEKPRHIEFQVLADRHGEVRHLFERDCSIQRRHQKVIEESPAPRLPRAQVLERADEIVRVLSRMGYDVIGTVEMLRDMAGEWNFLEMNTRLQVEHAVTEEITGIDLVAAQVKLASGMRMRDVLPAEVQSRGHAIEARIYAEDPVKFYPSPGLLEVFRMPAGDGVRVETGYAEGNRVTPHYDPMIAKVIVHAPSRDGAIARLEQALRATEIAGLKTNLPFLLKILASAEFRSGEVHTGLVGEIAARH
ncbi:acetyl/propionyl/methylcrotonyl-CoA carboxylase subunit alpha [Variovorax sp. KK3]|uniref:acetyl-CoA carboxylase biotin carboxylase subunit n=1 Tax=Variovorax sp. KK3 TaxID=1855728 RepID=UPI00097C2875|nr:biotin carboxylase N-terminal domain-containing protein [Variovorax sp. KK3]